MAAPTREQLFIEAADAVVDGRITAFSQLEAWVLERTPEPQTRNYVLARGLRLLKRLHWGVFHDLNHKDYAVLWRELVLPSQKYNGAGDLKKSLSISNIYIGMLDIHGYTAFCRQSKTNISKLHELDEFLSTTIVEVARRNGCIGNRERGDEILLVGARAGDVLRATVEIIQVFAKEMFLSARSVQANTEYSHILPKFHISAGIAGGNINSPMIITRKGEISGFLLNTAARLQARANKLAPAETKIIIARTVHAAFEKEARDPDLADFARALAFFDCGGIEFKGMSISHMEVLLRKEDRVRLTYQQLFLDLLAALQRNLWADRILVCLADLVINVLSLSPKTGFNAEIPGFRSVPVTPDALRTKLQVIVNLFTLQEDFISAIEALDELVMILSQMKGFEPIVLEYAVQINKRYRVIVEAYREDFEQRIQEKKQAVFNEQELRVYEYFNNNKTGYERLVEKARRTPQIPQKRQLWTAQIEKYRAELDFSLYSGKA